MQLGERVFVEKNPGNSSFGRYVRPADDDVSEDAISCGVEEVWSAIPWVFICEKLNDDGPSSYRYLSALWNLGAARPAYLRMPINIICRME